MAGLMKEFEPGAEVLIGRDADADVRLHPTEDNMVGRRHARLMLITDAWYIEPLHDKGVFVEGDLVNGMRPVHDNDVYRLGQYGPDLRVSLLGTAVPPTYVGGSAEFHSPGSIPQRRVEFDQAEIDASLKHHSHRTLKIAVLCGVLFSVISGFVIITQSPNAPGLGANEVMSKFGPSVFRAAVTVRFKCTHPDILEETWKRYWVQHGSAFVVATQGEWTYAVTNFHVFGEDARTDLASPVARKDLIERAVLSRWPQDWSRFATKLEAMRQARDAVDPGDSMASALAAKAEYGYMSEVVDMAEIDADDLNWRQIVVQNQFVPVEVVDASRHRDLVLFRFKAPRAFEPLTLRRITSAHRDVLSGGKVFVLGYPGAGDLPMHRSGAAMTGRPDVSQGVLSNIKGDDLHGGFSLQVTAPINEGHSGGPLFDDQGHVIGINTWGPSKAESEGISYAISLSGAIDMLRKHDMTILLHTSTN
jgi:hypothetical protein